jgi:hypothetical protein
MLIRRYHYSKSTPLSVYKCELQKTQVKLSRLMRVTVTTGAAPTYVRREYTKDLANVTHVW